jgi:hypothetical protein
VSPSFAERGKKHLTPLFLCAAGGAREGLGEIGVNQKTAKIEHIIYNLVTSFLSV